jgi:hypothetical protein
MGATVDLDPEFNELLGLFLEHEGRLLVVGGHAEEPH